MELQKIKMFRGQNTFRKRMVNRIMSPGRCPYAAARPMGAFG